MATVGQQPADLLAGLTEWPSAYIIPPQVRAGAGRQVHGQACRPKAWCGVVWCGVVWCGVVWCSVVWVGVV